MFMGNSSLNPAKTRECATGSVKMPCFNASVRKSPVGREIYDSRLSNSEAVSMLQSVVVLAAYTCG